MTAPADITALLGELSPAPGYAEVQRVGNKLLRRRPPEDWSAGRQIRIALASSFTIDPVAPALAVGCHQAGVWPEIQIDGFDLFRPHILDPKSPLYTFGPDIVFLAAELAAYCPSNEVVTDAVCEQVEALVAAFTRHSKALLVLHDFAVPVAEPFSLAADAETSRRVTCINHRLADKYREHPQVRVLPFDRLCGYHGKSRTTDPKLHYLGAIEVGESFLPLLVRQYVAYVKVLKGLTRKCVVVDLDGTLWGGVVGEDGVDGIRLARHGPGSEYRDLQRRLLALRDRGVLLAVNSKNNPADALPVFRRHPDMLLREEHFASIRINWTDKATNLRAIAEELNIGLDSLAFLDDNPAERAWIRQTLPEVCTVELPPDPTLFPRTVAELTDFEVLSITAEDRQRGELYAADWARHEFEGASRSFAEFVRGLRMTLTVGSMRRPQVPRVAQLTRKTNQFNLTTKRYSDAEIEAIRTERDGQIYTLRVRDAFGDNGLVGVAILRPSRLPAEARLDTFLLSCRVLGRTVEHAFLAALLADARRRGVTTVEADFIPTAKNVPAASFLKDFGLTFVAHDGGHTRWRLDLARWNAPAPDGLTVEWSDEDGSKSDDE
jgi:FkbH-like protein